MAHSSIQPIPAGLLVARLRHVIGMYAFARRCSPSPTFCARLQLPQYLHLLANAWVEVALTAESLDLLRDPAPIYDDFSRIYVSNLMNIHQLFPE